MHHRTRHGVQPGRAGEQGHCAPTPDERQNDEQNATTKVPIGARRAQARFNPPQRAADQPNRVPAVDRIAQQQVQHDSHRQQVGARRQAAQDHLAFQPRAIARRTNSTGSSDAKASSARNAGQDSGLAASEQARQAAC